MAPAEAQITIPAALAYAAHCMAIADQPMTFVEPAASRHLVNAQPPRQSLAPRRRRPAPAQLLQRWCTASMVLAVVRRATPVL
jgi:hypothetical protein